MMCYYLNVHFQGQMVSLFVSVHFDFKSEITLTFFCRMKYKIPPISGVARLFGSRGKLIRTAARTRSHLTIS